MQMPIFYPGPGIRITGRSLELQSGLRVRIPHRGRVLVVTPPVAGGSWAVRTYCSAGAAGLVVLQVAGPGDGHAPGLVFAILVGGIVVDLARRRRSGRSRQELWVDVGGRLVRLYSSHDPVEFGQVRRALLRAIEYNEDAMQ
jgi:hypothetical protein